jgi:hypothetical protein
MGVFSFEGCLVVQDEKASASYATSRRMARAGASRSHRVNESRHDSHSSTVSESFATCVFSIVTLMTRVASVSHRSQNNFVAILNPFDVATETRSLHVLNDHCKPNSSCSSRCLIPS